MNVNVVAQNPGWGWYIVVAGPIFILVFGVWIFCKYLPVCCLDTTATLDLLRHL